MSRPLRDRLAEIMRRSRLGGSGGDYTDQPEELREEWRRSADALIREAPDKGISIKDDRGTA